MSGSDSQAWVSVVMFFGGYVGGGMAIQLFKLMRNAMRSDDPRIRSGIAIYAIFFLGFFLSGLAVVITLFLRPFIDNPEVLARIYGSGPQLTYMSYFGLGVPVGWVAGIFMKRE